MSALFWENIGRILGEGYFKAALNPTRIQAFIACIRSFSSKFIDSYVRLDPLPRVAKQSNAYQSNQSRAAVYRVTP